ncbi:GAF domain-containing protein [Chryseolinea lacunae]|uniref:GAF domain-containing protein n=1 Tax=Chryseolinea lacunae TaxID=2801331 RepID=A0ABS1KN40_9BACT|nr:GAF domain-containing protein [Chryseolinea lacunae]MBL0740875.1 GAF domain-containing protein [Chryseolinea lacunae]
MNFWRNTTLKQWGIYALVLMAILFVAEFFAVRHTIQTLNEAERKIDFARSIQVRNQEVALQVQQYLHGRADLGTQLVSDLDQQEHVLQTLAQGGRIDGTDFFLAPLSRLPRITYDNLFQYWTRYKTSLNTLLTEKETVTVTTAAPAPVADTLAAAEPAAPIVTTQVNPKYTQAKSAFEAQWISVSHWYDRLIKDLEDEIATRQQTVMVWLAVFFIVDVVLLFGLLYAFDRFVLKPIQRIEDNTENHTHTNGFATNEIGHLARQINSTIENLKDATDFVTAIGEGRLDMDYQQAFDSEYRAGKNKLADSLIEMQNKLKAMNEEERKRQWANEGLAKFVDILRSSNDNLVTLGDKVIAALVQYTGSNQGGLYLLNEEDANDKHLLLTSLFAFDIKKFEERKIKLGEGILGQTFLEKETTYLSDIPEEYIRITSGLGDAPPRSILMVPLKVDTQVYGIIELASFNAYQPHEIAFVEKLSESIAATLASVTAAQKNRNLIEQFQEQTEVMRAQEEEMRQNMEEMQATQEEVARKENSYVARIRELETAQPKPSHSEAEIKALQAEWSRKEREYQQQAEALETRLAQQPAHGNDWALAEEVAKSLSVSLQALQITQEELDKKSGR